MGNLLRGKLAMFLLGIWLILTGLIPVLNLNMPGLDAVLAIIAIVVGILIILDIKQTPFKNIGRLLLAIWLILMGLIPLLSITFPASGTVLAVLAIAAGVLLLFGK